MPYFIIIPIWLAVLGFSVVLAFLKNTRIVALYLSICSTAGLVTSIFVSTFALLIVPRLPFARGSTLGGAVFLLGYIGGIILGGVAGIAIAFWATRKLIRKRTIAAEI